MQAKSAPAKPAPAKSAPAKSAPAKKAVKKAATPKAESNIKQTLAVGLKRGHAVTKRKLGDISSRRKGRATKRVTFIRELVREVAGYAPYERRLMELLRNGLEKRAMKLAKKKLGTRLRAKRKFNEMSDSLRKMREAREREQK